MAILDLTGKSFGKLTVVCKEYSKKRNLYWKCLCDCGNIRIMSTSEINRGRSPVPSCGCYRPVTDLTGRRINWITVVKLSHKVGYDYKWLCRCKCGKEKIISGKTLMLRRVQSCGCKRLEGRSISKLKKRLMSHIEITESGCWNWTGPVRPGGYGNWGSYPSQTAHRASFFIFNGELPKGKYICHHCDNKICVNPDHLYAGTAKENTQDAVKRGLHPKGPNKKKGSPREKNNKAKLSEDQVGYIRYYCDNGFKKKEMANFFGVNVSTIRNIAARRTWA